MRFALLLGLGPLLLGIETQRSFDTSETLDAFLFPADPDRVEESVRTAFDLSRAGPMVTIAARLGPEYGTRTAAVVPAPEFQASYRDLARYLDMFGPCQKQQMKDAPGWWSNYPDPPSEGYCREVTKLLVGNMLWTQVHYCKQLQTGEAKPKVAVDKPPPYRLDEPPVQTIWLKTEVLYALADGAIGTRYAEALRRRAAATLDPRDQAIAKACLDAAVELSAEHPSRELVALALAKLLAREYEVRHLHHLDRLTAAPVTGPPS